MRPRYIVIQQHPNLWHIVDINAFDTKKEMKKFVHEEKKDIYDIQVYEHCDNWPCYKLIEFWPKEE